MKLPTADASPAAQLRELLDDALKKAHFTALVTSDDGGGLNLTVHSHKAPFAGDVESASGWLNQNGITATVTLNETGDVVLTLPAADSVRQLIASLLQPWIDAYTASDQLVDLLEAHDVPSEAAVGTSSLQLSLPDDELGSVVTLAALLGVPEISVGHLLDRSRIRDTRLRPDVAPHRNRRHSRPHHQGPAHRGRDR
ncbi:hypothetical protein EASAB2608_05885 [Streptomyces sp. EAS-AB2608]|nr:hypothetical protein [Streptomyces sp. EAS-AB2608]BCM70551.1 hypothetical protein EASAB2608_05885 [Streptomyces sp. EAS-AB2608]CUW32246.1 hypothetical protein TUE45_06995 [Streptomyces reticuli]